MKTVGAILSTLLDESFVKKAHGYSKLFDSWEDITAKNGIAAAAAHSRIKELEKGILIIEIDHPGWKQILQTKQSKLLNDFHIRFPDMDISGISLILGKSKPSDETQTNETQTKEIQTADQPVTVQKLCNKTDGTLADDLDEIKDDELREVLLKLGQTIAKRESLQESKKHESRK